jgi:hypothetical protein
MMLADVRGNIASHARALSDSSAAFGFGMTNDREGGVQFPEPISRRVS